MWPACTPVCTCTGIPAAAQRRQNVRSSPISDSGAPTGTSRNHGAAMSPLAAATFPSASRCISRHAAPVADTSTHSFWGHWERRANASRPGSGSVRSYIVENGSPWWFWEKHKAPTMGRSSGSAASMSRSATVSLNTMSVSSISSHGDSYSFRNEFTSWLRPVAMFGPDW